MFLDMNDIRSYAGIADTEAEAKTWLRDKDRRTNRKRIPCYIDTEYATAISLVTPDHPLYDPDKPGIYFNQTTYRYEQGFMRIE